MVSKTRLALLLLIASAALLTACGQTVGTECEISGSGFHAKDPCAHQCLSRWSVNCPNDLRISPKVCTGKAGCTPGSCGPGLACYSFDDPFEERSYCVPDKLCGDDLSPAQLLQWEHDSAATALALREKYAAKQAKRTNQVTKEAPADEERDKTELEK